MVSPAAQFYLRTFGLTQKDVVTSDPKGILQKYDVLAYVQSHKLVKNANKHEEPKKVEKPVKAASKTGNPNCPLSQSFKDLNLEAPAKAAGDNLLSAKRHAAHTYFTSQIRIDNL